MIKCCSRLKGFTALFFIEPGKDCALQHMLCSTVSRICTGCLQGEELEPARKRAEEFGVKEIYIDDLREEFVRDYVFPMFRSVGPPVVLHLLRKHPWCMFACHCSLLSSGGWCIHLF